MTIRLTSSDTGYEALHETPSDIASLPRPLFRRVYIDALTEPGLGPAPQIGAEEEPRNNIGRRQSKAASSIQLPRGA